MTRKEKIKKDVMRTLAAETEAAFSDIHVSATESGKVTLTGTVPTYEAAYSAERAALRVPGVKSLSSLLEAVVGVGA